eukprot:TRINITY_DN5306_c1_g1_i2.p1 TRINITY_DN5306_c1_g1~~TRINITY_DN5306_c1_g1_i2.p1  ORF type:complete len:2147 (+),score=286.97 TRINITY_DN5306_c1_g1_i2:56-6442(+)
MADASSGQVSVELGTEIHGGTGGRRGHVALPASVSCGQHWQALCRKTIILKKREWGAVACCPWCPVAALCEIVLPIAVLALLWWAQTMCSDDSGSGCKSVVLRGWGGKMPQSNVSVECTQKLPLEGVLGVSHCNAWTRYLDRPRPFIEVQSYMGWHGKTLALVYHDDADKQKVERFRDDISEWYPSVMFNRTPVCELEVTTLGGLYKPGGRANRIGDCDFIPNDDASHKVTIPSFKDLTWVVSEKTLKNYLDSANYGTYDGVDRRLFAAVVFNSIPGGGKRGDAGHWDYSIRMNSSALAVPSSSQPKLLSLTPDLKPETAQMYASRGFLSLQLLLDRHIIGQKHDKSNLTQLFEHNGINPSLMWDQSDVEMYDKMLAALVEPLQYTPQAVESGAMPVAGIVKDGFYGLVEAMLGLLFIISFLYTQKKLINELVIEKETKVRESLRMIGSTSSAIIGSWYAIYGVIFFVLCAIFAFIAGSHIFLRSNTLLVFIFFYLWCMAFLACAFFIHCFFTYARTGGIVGVMLMFAQWMIYKGVGLVSRSGMMSLMLMPNACFTIGIEILSSYEAAQLGCTWTNMNMTVNNVSFLICLIMFCVDIFLYTLLGWYFELVLPKEYGVRLPVLFPFKSSYWCERTATHQRTLGDDDDRPAVCSAENMVEDVPAAVRAASERTGVVVRIRGLRREFQTPGGLNVAVADLNLTMYESQILALLGHNGAGKSTTINMLTGMLAPTSGDAEISGYLLSDGMGAIRKIIGVCPQHDVLWLELTVIEHLYIYGRVRGVASANLETRAVVMMEQVGLTEKRNTRAGSLSGGQKRKLSLCLAIIGQPMVIFLDEPTSGMDPYSRRSTWNIIRHIREGCVTVLTTHFMDEADILGDRIAIMAKGELQCCGSSLFLKNRFGAGYRLTCARLKGIPGSTGSKMIVDVVQRHVPEAVVQTDVGAELKLGLPTDAAAKFPPMLTELENNLEQLGLEHYGLQMVTLEEVFLCVASGEIERLERRAAGEAVQQLPSASKTLSRQSSGRSSQSADAADVERGPPPPHGTGSMAEPLTAADSQQAGVHRELSFIGLTARHIGALFLKRARYGRRDWGSICCSILIPVLLLVCGFSLLFRERGRVQPDMEMSFQEQYGRKVQVPFYGANQAKGLHADAEIQNTALNLSDVKGFLWGRDYQEDGVPAYVPCELKHEQGGKCYNELNVCPTINQFIQILKMVGITVLCTEGSSECTAKLNKACDHGQARCVDDCKNAESGANEGACADLCRTVCSQSKFCSALTEPIYHYCPVTCAGEKGVDPSKVCPFGSSCQKLDYNAANGASTLEMSKVLYEQGLGVEENDAHYGALITSFRESLGTAITVVYNTSSTNALPTYFNLASDLIKQNLSPESSITARNHPFELVKGQKLEQITTLIFGIIASLMTIMAFSFIPSAIVAYVVREREAHHNSKHQQLISGVGLLAYWVANFMWDVTLYLVPLILSLSFIKFYDIKSFVDNGALMVSFVLFLGYGIAVTPFAYMLSFLFKSHPTAQVISLVVNFVTGLVLMITDTILSNIETTKHVNEQLEYLYAIFPGFNFAKGIFQLVLTNTGSEMIDQQAGGLKYKVDLWEWKTTGKQITLLYVEAAAFLVIVIVLDWLQHSKYAAAGRCFGPQSAALQEVDVGLDSDVVAEAQRVLSGGADGDVVCVVNLQKVYRTPEGTNKAAVRGLSFGIERGECFGFLGINGAGKTSTLNMLTGAILPSGGTAYLGGKDIITEQWEVRRLLGYCPQHDALLDKLTVIEHLYLFGRVKRIKSDAIVDYCERMMKDLSLEPHKHKKSMTLSGGNKRKLSLAISLMGSPPLVLLDEPSTGVDPSARRLMWTVIAAVSTERQECSVMLTTHNMEEAEALCSRIGIMVGGRLRCLGSNQHLKAKFGQGYELEVRLTIPDAQETQAMVDKMNLPRQLTQADIFPICQQWDRPARANLVREGCEEGQAIYEAISKDGSVPAAVFAEWWLEEDHSEGLISYLGHYFRGTQTLERHGRMLRFRLGAGCSLADVFHQLETSKEALHLEEYGINQTSLEQIFNNFAARQQEETGAVAGLFLRSMESHSASASVAETSAAAGPSASAGASVPAAQATPAVGKAISELKEEPPTSTD